ncbi:MAG: Fic family protein [Bacteroidia bacterium]|nr:Fic family protein [Bacteroidia bacterium]MDW8014559.1 Fic family protein [Bacteroidia bacterium]
MSTILATHGLNFRSVWVDLPFSRWDLLAPSWKARHQYLDSQGEKSFYERDAYAHWARDFLALQGIARFSAEGWRLYQESGYESTALLPSEVYPSVKEAHASLQGLVEGMQLMAQEARRGQALDVATFLRAVERAYGQTVSFRTTPLNGPLRTLPPTEIEPTLGALLSEIHTQFSSGVSPLALSAWAHHVLTQVRPFADGNARAAFLLSQYILWRAGLPGLHFKPSQRLSYYKALQKADEGTLLPWAQAFLLFLQQAVLYALSWGGRPRETTRDAALQSFNQRFADWRSRHDRERSQRIMNNRYTIFDYMEESLRSIATDLDQKLKVEEGRSPRVLVAKAYPDSPYYYQFTTDIIEYARAHGYYFNRGLPRGWFKLKFSLSANKKYQLVFSLHHAGHEDATLVVGAFFHFLEPLKYQQKRLRRRRTPRRKEKAIYLFAPLPFKAEPIAFSIEQNIPGVRSLLREYAENLVIQALNELTNEIY